MNRTDPCPCNSGRLYKDCHMRKFNPDKRFKVKVTGGTKAPDFHLIRQLGSNEWKKEPGRMALRIGYKENKDKDIENILIDIFDEIPKDNTILLERVSRLEHKLHGIKYHLNDFIKEEKRIIENFLNEYEAPGNDTEYQNPNLIYSMESFLFQCKSALDILSQIISMLFDFKKDTYAISKDKGNIIVKKLLEQNSYLSNELAKILKKYDSWIKDTIDMRDEVTHFSNLQGFLCFVQHAWNGNEFAYISYPSMPDGQRSSTYIIKTFKILTDLILGSVPIWITNIKQKQILSNQLQD
jgi:hypothetical protein